MKQLFTFLAVAVTATSYAQSDTTDLSASLIDTVVVQIRELTDISGDTSYMEIHDQDRQDTISLSFPNGSVTLYGEELISESSSVVDSALGYAEFPLSFTQGTGGNVSPPYTHEALAVLAEVTDGEETRQFYIQPVLTPLAVDSIAWNYSLVDANGTVNQFTYVSSEDTLVLEEGSSYSFYAQLFVNGSTAEGTSVYDYYGSAIQYDNDAAGYVVNYDDLNLYDNEISISVNGSRGGFTYNQPLFLARGNSAPNKVVVKSSATQ